MSGEDADDDDDEGGKGGPLENTDERRGVVHGVTVNCAASLSPN